MSNLNYLLLAVRSPRESAELYTRVLGAKPVENQETFVLYVLPNGLKVGLWRSDDMKPEPRPAGGVEVSFTEDSREAMLETYSRWKSWGLNILQEPTDMDFGFTFVAEDRDGHRLRPFVMAHKPR
jgi:catechol 2,3-dioxygenase-like lactoylglutathione lyase family enzyme